MLLSEASITNIFCSGDSLMKAQLRKLDSLIEQAQLKESDNVLEIGFGWGSLAIRAVQVRDCADHRVPRCRANQITKPTAP